MKSRAEQGAALLLLLLILMLGSLHFILVSANADDTHRNAERGSQYLERAKEALIGHALETGCLPCPANSPVSGTAPSSCASAASRFGHVPWKTLGIPATDPWGAFVRYRVSRIYATGDCSFTASSVGDAEVATRDAAGNRRILETSAPFVLVSHGPDKAGAMLENGQTMPPPPASHVDERTNLQDPDRFYSRPWSEDIGVAGGPFDDLTAWIDPGTLCRRLAIRKGWSCP